MSKKIKGRAKKAEGVISYKRALISARAIEKDKALQSETAEKFLAAVQPYLTKKGEVRKNLSAKRKKEFNTLVANYKSTGYSTKKSRAEGRKKQTQTGIQRGTWVDRNERLKIVNAFKNRVVAQALKDGILDSEQIVRLRKTFDKLTPKKLEQAINEMRERRYNTMPAEAMNYARADDSERINNYLDIEDIIINDLGIRPNASEEIPFD